jgi:predicted nucleic acid-binding protein
VILVDTSVWVEVLRDKSGRIVKVFRERAGDEIIVFSRFTQLELLQGAKNEQGWQQLDTYLSTQYYLKATEDTWRDAARIYFELRKNGITINSPIDCCIAQLAIEAQVLLLHRDKDFERIAKIRPLAAERFKLR